MPFYNWQHFIRTYADEIYRNITPAPYSYRYFSSRLMQRFKQVVGAKELK